MKPLREAIQSASSSSFRSAVKLCVPVIPKTTIRIKDVITNLLTHLLSRQPRGFRGRQLKIIAATWHLLRFIRLVLYFAPIVTSRAGSPASLAAESRQENLRSQQAFLHGDWPFRHVQARIPVPTSRRFLPGTTSCQLGEL